MIDNKKNLILDFVTSDYDKSKIKKTIQLSLMKLNDPIKVSVQLNKILKGDISFLHDEEIEEIYKNIKDLDFTKVNNNQTIFNNENKSYEIYDNNNNLEMELKRKEEEIKKLQNELSNERELRKKLENIIFLTKKQSPIESTDNDINELYLKYLASGEEKYQSAIIAKHKDMTIIPKAYYVIK